MRRAEPTNRTTNRTTTIAAATTTLVALVAMAAVSPRAHGLAVARIAQAQVAVARGDAPVVRAVAAAVRDLLASSRAGTTLSGLPGAGALPVAIQTTAMSERKGVGRGPVADDRPPMIALLGEHRLDLPPPTC